MDFTELEKKLGATFAKQELLEEAMTHRSFLNERPSWPRPHNERLEFLGDAVLELVVTKYLYAHYPNNEGELTSFRAALVNADTLGQTSLELGVNDFLLLSKGEAKDVGRGRQEILGNAFEALVGALYLDGGYDKAEEFIVRTLIPKIDGIISRGLHRDPKSRFQEESQARVGITPSYRVLREWGPDHEKQFVAGVFLGEEKIAEGQGFSKQEAEVQAAQKALEEKGWK